MIGTQQDEGEIFQIEEESSATESVSNPQEEGIVGYIHNTQELLYPV